MMERQKLPLSTDEAVLIDAFVREHDLPSDFVEIARTYFIPLARAIHKHRGRAHGWLVGMNGAQGTGKSTLGALLAQLLFASHGARVALLSLDDFYLTRGDRDVLARTEHPLLKTRGVPGTHDVDLLLTYLERLKVLRRGQSLTLPRFDKSTDDRCPRSDWHTVTGPVDITLLEGWCVGADAEPAAALTAPINSFERDEDSDGRWRTYVNEQLDGPYRALHSQLDALVYLNAPDFESIYAWRLEQEQKLASLSAPDAPHVMSPNELRRFIQHFERLTRAGQTTLRRKANWVLDFDRAHNVIALTANADSGQDT